MRTGLPGMCSRRFFGIGAPSPTRLSWDALEAVLEGPAGRTFFRGVDAALAPAVAALGWPGIGLAVSGLCFMLPRVERLVRTGLGAGEPFDASLAPTRPALGVSAMAAWLDRAPGRRVELARQGGVFLEAGGSVRRLLSAEALSRVGREGGTFRRLARISVPGGHDREVLGIHFLQGVGDVFLDGLGLGLWMREVGLAGEALDAELDIALTLRRSGGSSGRLRGTARVRLGALEEAIRLRFIDPGMVFNSRAVRAAGVGPD